MRNLYLLILILFTNLVNAQDTLRSSDMPVVGRTYLISTGSAFTGMDPTATGAGFDWDFSELMNVSQKIDTCYNTSATNPLLSFYFIDNMLNSNRANQSFRGNNFNLGFTGLTDIFNYYYNTSSLYKQPGFGAVVNGVPIPIPYIPHDVIYRFPLKYNDADSGSYQYSVDLSSTIGIYYHVDRSRHNLVDGWGTLTTPYGTFDVIRVKSTLEEVDSTYVTSLNLGVKTPPITTIEYKWLGAGFGVPLLQINTNNANAISQILYQDSIRLTSVPYLQNEIGEAVVFPNPAFEKIILKYSLVEKADVKISLLMQDGKLIAEMYTGKKFAGDHIESIDLGNYNLSAGNYFIKIQSGNSTVTRQLQINR
jgi:hypothetical protein